MNNTYNTFFVVNPASAHGRTKRNWLRLEAYLRQNDLDFAYKFTAKPMEAINITREALYNGYSRIVSVGGDGTLNEVLNGFYDEEYRKINTESFLTHIPMGTGGDFARMFNISADLSDVYNIMTNFQEYTIDIVKGTYTNFAGLRESRFLINVADVGLGCQTVYTVNNRSKILGGFLSFLTSALISLLTYESQLVTVKIDGNEVYNGKLTMVVVSNGSYFGGGMKIAPKALLNDGLLDITIVNDLTKLGIIQNVPGIYQGKHVNHPAVSIFKGESVELSSPAELLVEFDGETPGMGSIILEVMPNELKLLL